jgi:hypothetical protein
MTGRGRPPKWMQGAHLKKGTFSRQVGIPEKANIPLGLINEIRAAPVGSHVQGPHGWIPVTTLLKKRANLARTLKRM